MLNRDSTSTVFVSLLGLVSIDQKKDTFYMDWMIIYKQTIHLQTSNTFTNRQYIYKQIIHLQPDN